MQVFTCMHPTPRRSEASGDTRQRLLTAAARVFAQYGLAGATTRAIAQEAGVNEVTLFRHFRTKDRLLAAVVGNTFGPPPEEPSNAPATTADFRADLLEHARRYERVLKANLPLVRTMLGEIHHRHRDHEKQVFQGIFGPIKAAILARIELAQAAGQLTAHLRADVIADLFAGMIFTGVLRRAAPDIRLDYSAATYVETAVDLVLGLSASPRGARDQRSA